MKRFYWWKNWYKSRVLPDFEVKVVPVIVANSEWREEVVNYADFVVANVAEFAANLMFVLINHSIHWSPVSNEII